jgi:RimJ/RimL family protein N-acetyltransferase
MLSGSLETERLVLRPWREEDAVDLQRLFGDLAVRGGRDMSPDRIARLADGSVQQWRVNGFGPWAAIDKTTGRWIGRLGLDDLDDWPGRRQDRGRLRAASSLMGPRPRDRRRPGGVALRLRAARPGPDHQCHRRGHTAARRVMEKAGLTYQGTRFWKNPSVPVVWYAIDRSAWRTTRP